MGSGSSSEGNVSVKDTERVDIEEKLVDSHNEENNYSIINCHLHSGIIGALSCSILVTIVALVCLSKSKLWGKIRSCRNKKHKKDTQTNKQNIPAICYLPGVERQSSIHSSTIGMANDE